MVGLYVPNGTKENFFIKLKQKLDTKTYDQIMIMGDFNGIMDPQLAKTSNKKGGKVPKLFFDFVQQEVMEDIWRLFNKKSRDYAYYSASKNLWTRIDMIWATRSIIPLIKKVEILPRILSDHKPVLCILQRGKKVTNGG